MGMYVYVVATKGGYTVEFSCWQTPTRISKQIVNSSNPIQTYKNWVLGISEPRVRKTYSRFIDRWNEAFYGRVSPDAPVLLTPEDDGFDHLNELDSFISQYTEKGFTVTVESRRR